MNELRCSKCGAQGHATWEENVWPASIGLQPKLIVALREGACSFAILTKNIYPYRFRREPLNEYRRLKRPRGEERHKEFLYWADILDDYDRTIGRPL